MRRHGGGAVGVGVVGGEGLGVGEGVDVLDPALLRQLAPLRAPRRREPRGREVGRAEGDGRRPRRSRRAEPLEGEHEAGEAVEAGEALKGENATERRRPARRALALLGRLHHEAVQPDERAPHLVQAPWTPDAAAGVELGLDVVDG